MLQRLVVPEFSYADARQVSFVCFVVALMTTIFSFGAMFQPGWANGWPVIPKHTVFAVVVTSMMCAVAAMSAMTIVPWLCAFAQHRIRIRYAGSILLISVSTINKM
ncbi:MAG: hypothetical protein AAFN70_18175, partial [Planctomycetota bacterium]